MLCHNEKECGKNIDDDDNNNNNNNNNQVFSDWQSVLFLFPSCLYHRNIYVYQEAVLVFVCTILPLEGQICKLHKLWVMHPL
jgi:hypothetical protein